MSQTTPDPCPNNGLNYRSNAYPGPTMPTLWRKVNSPPNQPLAISSTATVQDNISSTGIMGSVCPDSKKLFLKIGLPLEVDLDGPKSLSAKRSHDVDYGYIILPRFSPIKKPTYLRWVGGFLFRLFQKSLD